MDVTIITPTIPSRHKLLSQCIESVANQLVMPKDHLIGIDFHANGPSYIRNKLVRSVDTEWIAFLDDDDILYNNHIKEAYLKQNEADFIWTWCDSVGRGNFNPNSHFDRNRLLENGNYIPVTVFIKTEFFNRVGGFDLNARLEDWDLWCRLLRETNARFLNIPKTTWCYRFMGNNRTFADE